MKQKRLKLDLKDFKGSTICLLETHVRKENRKKLLINYFLDGLVLTTIIMLSWEEFGFYSIILLEWRSSIVPVKLFIVTFITIAIRGISSCLLYMHSITPMTEGCYGKIYAMFILVCQMMPGFFVETSM